MLREHCMCGDDTKYVATPTFELCFEGLHKHNAKACKLGQKQANKQWAGKLQQLTWQSFQKTTFYTNEHSIMTLVSNIYIYIYVCVLYIYIYIYICIIYMDIYLSISNVVTKASCHSHYRFFIAKGD